MPVVSDDDAGERRDPAGLHPVGKVGQRVDHLAAHGAAKAPVGKLDHPVARRLDEEMVDPRLAELVDDDGRIGDRGIGEKAVQQRCLAGTEEAGENGDADRKPRKLPRRAQFAIPPRRSSLSRRLDRRPTLSSSGSTWRSVASPPPAAGASCSMSGRQCGRGMP